MKVLLAVEQLRRSVPGGIGRYAAGLAGGLAGELGGDEQAGGDLGVGTPVAVALLASRPPGRRAGAAGAAPPGAAAPGAGASPGQAPAAAPGAAPVPPGADPLGRWGFPVLASRLPGVLLTRAWDRGRLPAPPGFDLVHSVSLAGPPVRPDGVPPDGSPVLVVTVHDLAWRHFPEATTTRGRRWHEAALQRALRRADLLLAPSEPVADDLYDAGAREGTVRLLHWGADHLPPPDHPAAASLLARLGVAGPYLLSASTREPRKNLDRLVAAYAAAQPSLPEPWPLVVVGPHGWGDVALGATADPRSPMPLGVVAAGAVSDEVLAGLYEGARAFAYVPLAEGYGLPPLEAMAMRVPVVASTGVPSVAPGPGEPPAALRVDPLDTGAIAGALAAAATDEPLRRDLVERGSTLVRSRTWRRCARQHLELWASLL